MRTVKHADTQTDRLIIIPCTATAAKLSRRARTDNGNYNSRMTVVVNTGGVDLYQVDHLLDVARDDL